MRVEGQGGELRHGYALAGRIGRWALRPREDVMGSDESVVTGEIWLEPFHGTQAPLRLVLQLGEFRWTWEDARVESGRLRVRGAPVEGVKVLHGA